MTLLFYSLCVVDIDRVLLSLHVQQLFLDKLTWLQARLLLALSMRLYLHQWRSIALVRPLFRFTCKVLLVSCVCVSDCLSLPSFSLGEKAADRTLHKGAEVDVLGCQYIYIVFGHLPFFTKLEQLFWIHLSPLRIGKVAGLESVCVDSILVMDATEALLQLDHQLDFRIQMSHLTHGFVEVDLATTLAHHNCCQSSVNRGHFFVVEDIDNVLLDLSFYEVFFVKLDEIDLVAKLLQHIVKHDFLLLVVGRDLQQANEMAPQSFILNHVLV